ncbi:hypothetical protein SK128_018473 [Halocaridina rubra]|uniref:Uncharacterized protein n=1 Tax=Halocaridina rubra TaxID=373956 RepID=A0AAN8WGW3_HALRR
MEVSISGNLDEPSKYKVIFSVGVITYSHTHFLFDNIVINRRKRGHHSGSFISISSYPRHPPLSHRTPSCPPSAAYSHRAPHNMPKSSQYGLSHHDGM